MKEKIKKIKKNKTERNKYSLFQLKKKNLERHLPAVS